MIKSRSLFAPAYVLAVLVIALFASCSTLVDSASAKVSKSDYQAEKVCDTPAIGYASCFAKRLVPDDLTVAAQVQQQRQDATRLSMGLQPFVDNVSPIPGSLTPAQLHEAYQWPTTTTVSSGQTIAIIDAYDHPNAEQDLNVYSAQFGLPACTTANGCFTKVNQNGQPSPLPVADGGWASEIALDIEMAHAICQDCKILLIEANSNSFSNLSIAVNRAATMGADVISNSYGGNESFGFASDTTYNHPGIFITASTGDWGYKNWELGGTLAPNYPASSPNVVAVGGTSLSKSNNVWNSTTWDSTGGGCSSVFTAKTWQQNVANYSSTGCGTKRLQADISAVADPYTGVAVYDSYPDGQGNPTGWTVFGGTSASAPIIGAAAALAGSANGVNYPTQTLYANFTSSPQNFYDITTGSNAPTSLCTNRSCVAASGYDGPTGIGSPLGLTGFIPAVALPPSNLALPVISPSNPKNSDTVFVTVGSWTNNPSSYTYQWQACDSNGNSCSNISGATSSSFTIDPSLNLVGDTLKAVVTATNNNGSASATSAATAVIQLSPPVNFSSPAITGSTTENNVLNVSAGSWTGLQPISYTYQWQACDSAGASCQDISGQTDNSLTVTSAFVGQRLKAIVTATNADGQQSASSNLTGVVTSQVVTPPPPTGGDSGTSDGGTGTNTGGETTTPTVEGQVLVINKRAVANNKTARMRVSCLQADCATNLKLKSKSGRLLAKPLFYTDNKLSGAALTFKLTAYGRKQVALKHTFKAVLTTDSQRIVITVVSNA